MPEFAGKEFDQWSDDCMVCTDFAAEFKQAKPEAKIKFGEVDGEDHAWAYDPEEDVTVDATLGQFLSVPEAEDDFFYGEEHPLAEEQEEFESVEEFAQGPGGNYLLD